MFLSTRQVLSLLSKIIVILKILVTKKVLDGQNLFCYRNFCPDKPNQ